MKLQNFSLALLVTATFGAGLFNDISATAAADRMTVRVANDADEISNIASRSQAEMDARMAAARAKFNELKAAVEEKNAAQKAAGENLSGTVALLGSQMASSKVTEAEAARAKAAWESDESYFLCLQLDDADRAALAELYSKKIQISDAIARAAANVTKMSTTINTSKDELAAKSAELETLNAEILDSANAEYTYSQPQAEVKGEEVSAKEAILAQKQAKQAELNAANSALESKIRASDAKLAALEARVPAAKAAKAVDKGASFQKILADQKAERLVKAADEASLLSNIRGLEQLVVEMQQLQDAISTLNSDIAALPAAVPGAAPEGETIEKKLARLPKLKARITKLAATQDSAGKLQTSLAQMKADITKLEAQSNTKNEEIKTFKERIIAQRASGAAAPTTLAAPAPLRRIESSPAIMAAAPALPPSGSAVVAPSELLAPLSPTAVSPSDGSAVPPAAVPAADAVVTGASGISAPPALKRAASEPALTRAQVAEQQHVERIGSGLTRSKGPTAAGNFNPPMPVRS